MKKLPSIRLLATLFLGWKNTYIHACIKGMAQNYTPIERIIFAGLTH